MNLTRRSVVTGLLGAAGLAVSAAPAFARIPSSTFLWPGSEDAGTVVIHTKERLLFHVEGDGMARAYPIAVGRDGMRWYGRTSVARKARNPTWYPTPRMRRENPRLPRAVGPGPSNPFGTHAIYLNQGLLRIHGTNAPSSIGKAASSGCYRMYNDHVSELYQRVRTGTPVIVV